MRTAVIFSVTIFDGARAWMMDKWMDVLSDKFSDCDIFVGINSGTHPDVINKINRANLKVALNFSPQFLYTQSDASAYQAALKTLKHSDERYGYYWFIHTKSGVNVRPDRFEYYLNEFLSKRTEIEDFLVRNPAIGSYGHYGVSQSADGVTQWKTLNHLEYDHGNIPIVHNIPFDKLTCTHINWSYVETFFILKGDALNWFLDKADNSFYDTKIKNRWYFEVVFPWLSSRFGLYPYVKNSVSIFSPSDLNTVTREWEEENHLHFPPIA